MEEKFTNDSFGADESEDARDREFFESDLYKGTGISPSENETEIRTPNGSQILSNGTSDRKLLSRTDTVPIEASPARGGSSISSAPDLTPMSPARAIEKRRAEDGEEPGAKRQKTVDYSKWKNDYEGREEEAHPDLVNRVRDFMEYKRTGANINREYRKKKEFKNPDILEKLVRYYGIIEIGSNYPASKFDPYKWKPTSFYDYIAEEQQRMIEKIEKMDHENKKKIRKKTPRKKKKLKKKFQVHQPLPQRVYQNLQVNQT